MNIAVLGTGMVGRAVAARLHDLGHSVVIGTRDPDSTLARTEPDGMGNPPFPVWHEQYPGLTLAAYPDAAADAELVVNATSGAATLDVLRLTGEENLAGKVLVDIANPLDFSEGFPPTLFVKDSDSLGEQVQRAFPATKVVKTLNTLNAHLMVEPKQLADGDHSVFVSGNDAQAKQTVTDLLSSMGHSDVIDLGDITTARGTEMLLPVWLRIMGTLGTPAFNLKVVR